MAIENNMSEQGKTPGQVCFEKWIELEIRPLVATPLGWDHADQIQRYNWEQVATAGHKAVEEQLRRESRLITINCDKCKSPVMLDHKRTCNVCGLVQSEE